MVDDRIPFYGRFSAITIVNDQMNALAPIRDGLQPIINIGRPFECIGQMHIQDMTTQHREASEFLHLSGRISFLFPLDVIGRKVSLTARVSPYPIYRRRER